MSKRKPNKAEQRHMGRVAELGCCICAMPAEIHHLLRRKGIGRRSSHFDVIPLCPTHHRTGNYGVAIHAGIDGWEANHGTEDYHLQRVMELIA